MNDKIIFKVLFIVISLYIPSTAYSQIAKKREPAKSSSCSQQVHKELIEVIPPSCPKKCSMIASEERKGCPRKLAAHNELAQQQQDATKKVADEIKCAPVSIKEPRKVEIKNYITSDMITYKKHWTGHHKPSKFSVKINNQDVPTITKETPPKTTKRSHQEKSTVTMNNEAEKEQMPQESHVVMVDNETVSVELYYKFKKMGITYKEETRQYNYKIPADVQCIETRFSWEEDPKIILEGNSQKLKPITITALK